METFYQDALHIEVESEDSEDP
jgi:hypothetical protein